MNPGSYGSNSQLKAYLSFSNYYINEGKKYVLNHYVNVFVLELLGTSGQNPQIQAFADN